MVVTRESKYQARIGEEGLADDCDTETTNDSQHTHTDGEATTGGQRQADYNRENPSLEDSDIGAATGEATTGGQRQADDNRENPFLEDSDTGVLDDSQHIDSDWETTDDDQSQEDDDGLEDLIAAFQRRNLSRSWNREYGMHPVHNVNQSQGDGGPGCIRPLTQGEARGVSGVSKSVNPGTVL